MNVNIWIEVLDRVCFSIIFIWTGFKLFLSLYCEKKQTINYWLPWESVTLCIRLPPPPTTGFMFRKNM